MKKCTKCNIEKQETLFFKDKKSKDGLQYYCKSCKSLLIGDYYKSNPSKKAARTKKQGRERYYSNKVNFNMSRRIRQSLKGIVKNGSWVTLIDFTLDELKNHLESKFDKNMTWDNYGFYWHIDHILPITYFNILSTSCKDFKKCWSLNNLQPLEAKQNIRKSNKLFYGG